MVETKAERPGTVVNVSERKCVCVGLWGTWRVDRGGVVFVTDEDVFRGRGNEGGGKWDDSDGERKWSVAHCQRERERRTPCDLYWSFIFAYQDDWKEAVLMSNP